MIIWYLNRGDKEVSHEDIWKNVSVRGSGKCKGPEVEAGLAFIRNSKASTREHWKVMTCGGMVDGFSERGVWDYTGSSKL